MINMKHETAQYLAKKVITFFSTGNHSQSWQFLKTYVDALHTKIIYDNLEADLIRFFDTHPSISEIQFNIVASSDFNSVEHELTNLNLVKGNELKDNVESIAFLQNLSPFEKAQFLLESYVETWEYFSQHNITTIHRSNVAAAFEHVLQGTEREVYEAVKNFERNQLENCIVKISTKGRPNKI